MSSSQDTLELITSLSNNLSINIKEISFKYVGRYCESLHFEKFLENCHNCLEIINLNQNIGFIPLKTILDYIIRSNNSLKILGTIKSDKELNNEELELLDQIKAEGVKIVDFHSIYHIAV